MKFEPATHDSAATHDGAAPSISEVNGHGKPPRGDSASAAPRPSLLARCKLAARELFAFARRERLWTAMMVVFILTWTFELFLVQRATLVFPNGIGPRYALWASKIRLVLDLLFVCTLTLSLRRRWLIAAAVGSFFVHLGLLTYFKFFLRPLSLMALTSTWREGLKLRGFAWEMFPRYGAMLLLVALAIKVAALVLSRRARLPRHSARLVGGACFAGFATLYAVTLFVDPLYYIQSTRGVGRLGYMRGYLGPWFAEWYYLRQDNLLEEVLKRPKYDRLTPLEAKITVRKHLAIVQCESFDTNVLGLKVDGVEVTPFLNQLRNEAMYYRVRAMHEVGSASADFAALNGVAGSARANTYRIPDYPYKNTTPQVLAECGYKTYSFFGHSGVWYNRRAAYEKMGFAALAFREELTEKYGLAADSWASLDADVLGLSAQELRDAPGPTCHFVITVTTHTPYTMLPAASREIYPNAAETTEHYLNNMRYLDNCLRDYITRLGRDTTVMLYADHPTEQLAGFDPDRNPENGVECIPCYIYDSNENLAKVQKTRDNPISTDGSLNLVDAINYLRAQVKRNCEATRAEAAASEAESAAPADSDELRAATPAATSP